MWVMTRAILGMSDCGERGMAASPGMGDFLALAFGMGARKLIWSRHD
jgi:hypothetical protein